jgi:hypothetical protein
MSACITRSVAATVAASALLGSAALAFPATANAAAPTPKPILQVTATATAPNARLQLGGAARTEILKVTNATGKAQKFHGELSANAGGAVYLQSGELVGNVTALGKTPATNSIFVSQSPGYLGAFYPKGHKFGTFTIPAHTTYSWKIAIAATKSFPLNDNLLFVHAGAFLPGASAPGFATVEYKVGNGHTGGPVLENLWGDVELTAYNHPAFEFLTVTNHTGAALKSWSMMPWLVQKPGAQLAMDVWVGSAAKGHWVPLTNDLSAAGLANGASKTFQLRVRVVHYNPKAGQIHDMLEVMNWNGDVVPAPHIGLTVH